MDKALLAVIRSQFQLDWFGIHGIPHWARVLHYGLKIAEKENARTDVVRLFSVLHDARRFKDSVDPEHGERAVEYAKSLRGSYIRIDQSGFDLLCEALAGHSEGRTESNITVQTCWDADRLDLSRIGIRPKAEFLCTATAKNPEFIERAWQRGNKCKTFDLFSSSTKPAPSVSS